MDSFEGHEARFATAGQPGGDEDGDRRVDVGRPRRIVQTRFDLVEHAEHDSDGTRFLDERRQNSSIQVADALAADLTNGGFGREAVQLLAENHFVQGKSQADVDET